MQDKLKKNGHKKGYYIFQNFIKSFLASVCLLVVASIPVGIAYRIAVYEETSKQIAPKERLHTVDDSEEDSIEEIEIQEYSL